MHDRKKRWAVVVAHRRAGKTVACINDLIRAVVQCRHPNPRAAYVAPFFSQAKDVAWNYLKHYTSAIPGIEINETELRVDFPGGARVRLYGADNYERLRGLYFDAVVLDEFGDMDPRAWQEVIRASLVDRDGTAIFIGTPKGMNHFAELWERAQLDSDWFSLKLKASDTALISPHELVSARKEMSEDQYEAEFECSFAASVVGSYWGREMTKAEADGRICRVPYQPEAQVDTWWDLGMEDATAVWFTQNIGREVHVIDYYEEAGSGLPGAIRELKSKPYIYGSHHAPHDIEVREWGSGEGKSRREVAMALGIRFEIVPNLPKQDGIDAARSFIARCVFDREATTRGRLALVSYQKTWDEKRKVFSSGALHNWASDGADAFRYLAVGHKTYRPKPAAGASRRVMTLGQSNSWMGS